MVQGAGGANPFPSRSLDKGMENILSTDLLGKGLANPPINTQSTPGPNNKGVGNPFPSRSVDKGMVKTSCLRIYWERGCQPPCYTIFLGFFQIDYFYAMDKKKNWIQEDANFLGNLCVFLDLFSLSLSSFR